MNTEKTQTYFKGILSNVDSSILQVDFGHIFKIEAFSEEEAEALLSHLEKSTSRTVILKYFMRFQSLNCDEHRMYTIGASLEKEYDYSFSGMTRFHNKWVRDYLEPKIRLMRLYKEGNICMPATFYYQLLNRENQRSQSLESGDYISFEPYHLEPSEIPLLQSFTQSIELPFKRDFLNLAFENFELSYKILDTQLAFLVLMIGLETLLNPSTFEITHRVSRNTAVLLGKDRKDSEEIFAQVKNLYNKRSEIVHSGKKGKVKKEDLLKLRDFLRKAIKEIYRSGMGKGEIMDLLDSHGFGESLSPDER